MSRLVAFGCSAITGMSLPDVYPKNNKTSVYAWPNTLAKRMQLECVNLGIPGNSNINILRQILNFEFKEKDIVVILWTHFTREDIFDSKDKVIHITADSKNNYNAWLRIYNDYALNFKNWLHIHHADLFLKTKPVTVIHHVRDATISKPDEIIVDNCIVEELQYKDYACDNYHMGLETQKYLEEKFYMRIMNVLR